MVQKVWADEGDKRLNATALAGAVPSYAGSLWKDGEATEGWIRLEKGTIVDEGSGPRPSASPAVMLDGVHDYHTHVGDAFLRGRRLPRSLDRLVRPPSGLKHRMLARASRSTIVGGIRKALGEYGEAGTRTLLDFREQGVAGVRLLEEARRQAGPEAPLVRLLGRSRSPADIDELEALLGVADGIGLPSYSDVGAEAAAAAANACKRARRVLALHASEARREPIEPILGLGPDLLVHLVKASPADLRRIAELDVPIALCPSSNAFFRLRSPVAAVHKAGLRFFFGTDNAMLGRRDLVAEAARARRLAPRVPDAALLRALTTRPEKAIKRLAAHSPGVTHGPERVLVLPTRGGRVRWGAKPLIAKR